MHPRMHTDAYTHTKRAGKLYNIVKVGGEALHYCKAGEPTPILQGIVRRNERNPAHGRNRPHARIERDRPGPDGRRPRLHEPAASGRAVRDPVRRRRAHHRPALPARRKRTVTHRGRRGRGRRGGRMAHRPGRRPAFARAHAGRTRRGGGHCPPRGSADTKPAASATPPTSPPARWTGLPGRSTWTWATCTGS